MNRKEQIYMTLANFGTYNCNLAHDINNILAIYMGYTEELEEQLKSGAPDLSSLQFILSKFHVANNRLTQKAQHISKNRRRNGNEPRQLNTYEFMHRWIKTTALILESWNLRILPEMTDDVCFYEVTTLELQNFWCDFMGTWLENFKQTKLTSIALIFYNAEKEFTFELQCAEKMPALPTKIAWAHGEVRCETTDRGYLVRIPCKKVQVKASSAA